MNQNFEIFENTPVLEILQNPKIADWEDEGLFYQSRMVINGELLSISIGAKKNQIQKLLTIYFDPVGRSPIAADKKSIQDWKAERVLALSNYLAVLPPDNHPHILAAFIRANCGARYFAKNTKLSFKMFRKIVNDNLVELILVNTKNRRN
jgi:hypothetical protein